MAALLTTKTQATPAAAEMRCAEIHTGIRTRTGTRPRTRTRWPRLVGCIGLAWSLQVAGLAQAGDLSAQMKEMFDNAGSLSNVTGPGAFRSQSQNIYTGGELQLRTPVRNYQLWSVTLPSIKAGCGGIDMYLGSFSHINSSQFKAMLQQIGANTVGLLFKAALKSINPMIEGTLSDLQKTVDDFNNFSRNSCQMANSLVNGMSGATGVNAYSACVSMARAYYGEDESAAQARCKDNVDSVNTDVKASSDPAVAILAQRDMNLIWEALKDSSFSKDEKELFLNIAGSVLLYAPANNGGDPKLPIALSPAVENLNVLLNGNAMGSSADTVVIKNWMSCADADCMTVNRSDKTITPFPTHVRKTLEALRDAMATKTAPTAAQIAFVNMTTVPVYRMLATGYTSDSAHGDSYLSDLLIARYARIIAFDYAYTFLSRALREVRTYIGAARLQNALQEQQAKDMRQRVDDMLAAVEVERKTAMDRVPAMNAVIDDIQHIERQMRLSLPSTVRNMMDFSNLMTGRRG